MTMPKLSGPEHRRPFSPPPSLQEDVKDIKKVLEALRVLDIARPLKRRMFSEALWFFRLLRATAKAGFGAVG